MSSDLGKTTRRQFFEATAAAGIGLGGAGKMFGDEQRTALAEQEQKALIAITMDLEMSRHYPTWELKRGRS